MLKPNNTPYRIYCAGPLFNPSERAEMEMLAETLEQAGFGTFLPHRDGLLFGVIVPDLVKAGYPLEAAQWMARQAIFALDVYYVVIGCDGALVNLNGRVPDEGALVEGAMAWTAGKAVVLFKDDARSLIAGLDNPLVAGLGSFRFVSHADDLPGAMSRALTESASGALRVESLTAVVRQGVERGQRIADVAATGNSAPAVRTIIHLFDEFQGAARSPARLSS
jgi:nucleoside 2-deoxyribosyltransferase